MDTKALVRKLHEIFVDNSKNERKYSQVWLSSLNYGGLYYSNDFVLKLKSEQPIERYLNEIKEVFQLLAENAKEESKSILRVVVYGPHEKAEREADDYLIYEDATAVY